MKKIRVLQIIDSLNVGGTEVLAVNLANSFLDYNISSHICTTRKEGILKEKLNSAVNYIYLKKKYIIDVQSFYDLKKYIKLNNINIIHAHSTSLFFGCCIKIICPHVKLFWHNHTGANIELKGIKYFVTKILSKYTNGIINVNEELRLWSKNKLNHQKSIKLNNFPLFTNNEKITTLKGIKDKRIVCVAALRPEKDHLNLLKAFLIVKKSFPDWTLHLIGKDYFDHYSKEIKKFILKNELEESIFIYDMCTDIKYILNQSTIGVLSSKNEGLPISLLEYGLAKLPALTTDVGECRQVTKNINAAVDSEDSIAFSKSLMKLIDDNELRIELSIILYENVKLYYSKNVFIDKIKKIYLN